MSFKDMLLFLLTRNILEKNKKFENCHQGETCYIFGNGASLKDMDLAKFSDKISIGCNFLCLHNDFRMLNIKYYTIIEPLFLYPIYKNPYTGEIQFNHLSTLFKKAMAPHKDLIIFTSVSNYLGLRGNISYLHHFGRRQVDLDHCKMDASFSFMQGSLHAMIGTAIYMGFKHAILVGCDYTFSPHKIGHFYRYERGSDQRCVNAYAELFEEASKCIDLLTITDNGAKSEWMKYQEYGEFAKSESKYRNNEELVRSDYLELLGKADRKQQTGL